jgi:indolepyruvate ferredoxin oxidoreductase
VSSRAVHRAIKLNAVKVKENEAAFDLGRLAAHDPARVKALLPPPRPEPGQMSLDALIAHRGRLLTDYQDAAYAARWRALVEEVRAKESALGLGEALTRSAAHNLAKLMTYKDEYEVARLFATTPWERELKAAFDGRFKVTFNLAPPLIAAKDRRTGHQKKRAFGAWMKPVFGVLARMKGLRGTAFDLFGRTAERRAERALLADYEACLRRLIDGLTPYNHALAVKIASVPDEIRGYGHVKAAAIDKARAAEAKLWAEWNAYGAKVAAE